MSDSETEIMQYFRRYRVEARQMLCFDTGPAKGRSSKFHAAMNSLIGRGLVVAEQHRGAYSLTPRGYKVSQTA